jgi:PPOX class probable F420-dependent enzyme
MDLTEAVERARTNHHSVLATRRADGSPQMSPVVHGVDGTGRIMISTREPAMKVRNLRREPRAWLCVLPDGFFGSWAQLAGPCEIVALPEAMPLLEDIYRQVAGEHPDWADFRLAMERERRVVLRITPDQVGPTASG